MQQDLQVRLTRQALDFLDAKTTALGEAVVRNPIASYTDPDRLAREKERLFRGHPLVVAASCQLREAGDYVTDDNSGVPVLVVRAEDGSARAFLNVCRHRGAKVVNGCGRIKRNFVCPYHAWSYDTEGRLVGIPDRESFDDLDTDGHGLVELPVVEKHGLIWVRSTPGEGFDIDDALAGLGPELGSYDLSAYHHYETRVIRRKMNWKVAMDTFLEPYHFGVLHTNTVAPIFFPNVYLFEPFGPNLREAFLRRTITELRDKPEAEWDFVEHTAIIYVLFPNTAVVIQADHVEIWRIYPAGDLVDECVLYLDFYIPEPATSDSAHRHWERNLDLLLRTVEDEDFPTGETIQFGFSSGAQDHVTYGRNEPALAHFETSVTRAVES
jgi:nitrite reductase/ring-hydroxylating ferredoxin subunit